VGSGDLLPTALLPHCAVHLVWGTCQSSTKLRIIAMKFKELDGSCHQTGGQKAAAMDALLLYALDASLH